MADARVVPAASPSGQGQLPEIAPAAEIVRAARAGLVAFLNPKSDRTLSDAQRLGFATAAEVEAAIVGEAFQVHSVVPGQLLGDRGGRDLHALAVPTGIWLFVVTSRGQPKSILTVDRVDGVWTAVSLGAAEMAAQLVSASQRWPASASRERRFIRAYQAKADFLEILVNGRSTGVLPFVSGRMALGLSKSFNPSDLRGSRSVVSGLKPVVAAALSGPNR